ncbi:MAG TPA: DUF948 domain-containing protein [Desulfuromonadales bacterium]|nr:DUF948 domain-containing protein [Desulfuromonadales bacterium]
MSLTGIALLIIALAFLILVLTLVPTILIVKRTASSVGTLTDMIQNELKPTIRELTAVLVELKTVGGGVAEHTDDVKRFMSALGETGTNLSSLNRSVGTVTTVLNNASILAIGAKAAGKYMLERYINKQRG